MIGEYPECLGCEQLAERARKYKALCRELKEALGFYGEPEHWAYYDGWHFCEYEMTDDPGEKARMALEKIKEAGL